MSDNNTNQATISAQGVNGKLFWLAIWIGATISTAVVIFALATFGLIAAISGSGVIVSSTSPAKSYKTLVASSDPSVAYSSSDYTNSTDLNDYLDEQSKNLQEDEDDFYNTYYNNSKSNDYSSYYDNYFNEDSLKNLTSNSNIKLSTGPSVGGIILNVAILLDAAALVVIFILGAVALSHNKKSSILFNIINLSVSSASAVGYSVLAIIALVHGTIAYGIIILLVALAIIAINTLFTIYLTRAQEVKDQLTA